MAAYRWFVTFIGCYSRVTWVCLLHNKNDGLTSFKSFPKMVQTQLEKNIKISEVIIERNTSIKVSEISR